MGSGSVADHWHLPTFPVGGDAHFDGRTRADTDVIDGAIARLSVQDSDRVATFVDDGQGSRVRRGHHGPPGQEATA